MNTTVRSRSIGQLREAAAAWRRLDIEISSRVRVLKQSPLAHIWPFSWMVPGEPNLSVHDRIDDLIDEIERLRDQIV